MTRYLTIIFILFPRLIWAQDAQVEFRVNMSVMIEQGLFVAETEFVDVAGTFNGWGEDLTRLSDNDKDSIYTITLGGFLAPEAIEFKFRINGQWDGREEFPGVGNNRKHTLSQGLNTISVWYNDIQPSDVVDPTELPLKAIFSQSAASLSEDGLVFFGDVSHGNVQSREWTFQGGQPQTSTEKNPRVRYPQNGTFDVELIVTDSDGQRDTLLAPDTVRVQSPLTPNPWWKDRVFYEIYVRSFFDGDGDGTGDFSGIIQKLDYLNDGDPNTHTDLGVTGIWLMPISESPSVHGYDVSNYKSVNPDYGTMDQFKTLVEEAHRRGISVIVDFVMNHASSEHPWFIQSSLENPQFADFFRWNENPPNVRGPWGQVLWHPRGNRHFYGLFWQGMPDINYRNPVAQDSMFSAADFWLEDVGVDGFRLDAVKYIFEEENIFEDLSETFDFWEVFNSRIKQSNPNALAVGEAWTATSMVKNYVSKRRLDLAFEFDLAGAIIGSVRSGSNRAFTQKIVEVMRAYPNQQFAPFLTNHDQNRIMDELGDDQRRMKAVASILLTLPGTPFMYYGEEVGMKGVKPDENIRRPMQWADDPRGGFSTTQPWFPLHPTFREFNVARQTEDPQSILSHYRRLIHLRNAKEHLRRGNLELMDTPTNVVAFLRFNDEGKTVTVVNLTNQDQSVSIALPQAHFSPQTYAITRHLVNVADRIESIGEQLILDLGIMQAYESRVFSMESTTLTDTENEVLSPTQFALRANFPNPFNPSTSIPFSLPSGGLVRLDIYNVLGERVSSLLNERFSAGNHVAVFDATSLTSGVYIAKLRFEGQTLTRKLTLVK